MSTVYVGADHNGYGLKGKIIEHLRMLGYSVHDSGDKKLDPEDDYPQFAGRLVSQLNASDDHSAKGVLICGSGQGMCIAANRYKGIRAAMGYDHESARSSRNDDDANVLCLPARTVNESKAIELVETFLKTPFAGAARFSRRIKEIDNI